MSGSTALGVGVTLFAIAVTLLLIFAWIAWDARRGRRGLLERVGAAQPLPHQCTRMAQVGRQAQLDA